MASIRTTGALPGDVEPIDVVGLPGATAGPGDVFVNVKGKAQEVSTTATEEGTFIVSIRASLSDILEVRYKSSLPAEVTVLAMPVMTPPKPDPAKDPITVPDQGLTTINGEGSAGSDYLAVNVNTGGAVTTTADASGYFSIQLEASTGDEIRVWLVAEPLGVPWVLTVP